MKKRSRDWRPTDGYEVAGSSNMFLDLKSGENDREEYLSDKVREYLQSLGMLSESKLPDMFYKDLESAIKEISMDKRKVTLSIKYLEEQARDLALKTYGSESSGKNLPFSSLSEDLKKKEEEEK